MGTYMLRVEAVLKLLEELSEHAPENETWQLQVSLLRGESGSVTGEITVYWMRNGDIFDVCEVPFVEFHSGETISIEDTVATFQKHQPWQPRGR